MKLRTLARRQMRLAASNAKVHTDWPRSPSSSLIHWMRWPRGLPVPRWFNRYDFEVVRMMRGELRRCVGGST